LQAHEARPPGFVVTVIHAMSDEGHPLRFGVLFGSEEITGDGILRTRLV
jgi:hypothetical protein